MKKKYLKGACVAVCGVLLAGTVGCSPEQKLPGEEGKIVITTWDKPGTDQPEAVKEAYEAKMMRVREKFPDIEIQDNSRTPGTDYRQQYDKALMAGEAPTYMSEFSYTDIPSRIKNGTVADVTEFVENWNLKKEGKVIEQFDNAISRDGKWFAIPREAYVQATLVNKKLLREAGEDPENLPVTWDEFTIMGERITDFEIPRIGYELVGMDWCAWPFTAWVWSAGGEMVRPNGDGTYKIAFHEEEGVETAMLLNQMVWKYGMTQKDVLQDLNKIQEDIKSGRACFAWASIQDFNSQDFEQYSIKLEDFGMLPMPVKNPSIKRPALAGGEVYTFNPKATKEELQAAWDVVTYMNYDEEELTAQWKQDNLDHNVTIKMPGRKDLYEKRLSMLEFIPEKIKQELLVMSESAIAEPFCPNWSDLKSELVNPLQKIYLTENISKEEVVKILSDCAEGLYKKYPNSFKK